MQHCCCSQKPSLTYYTSPGIHYNTGDLFLFILLFCLRWTFRRFLAEIFLQEIVRIRLILEFYHIKNINLNLELIQYHG